MVLKPVDQGRIPIHHEILVIQGAAAENSRIITLVVLDADINLFGMHRIGNDAYQALKYLIQTQGLGHQQRIFAQPLGLADFLPYEQLVKKAFRQLIDDQGHDHGQGGHDHHAEG